jgi:hypothetical protein
MIPNINGSSIMAKESSHRMCMTCMTYGHADESSRHVSMVSIIQDPSPKALAQGALKLVEAVAQEQKFTKYPRACLQ